MEMLRDLLSDIYAPGATVCIIDEVRKVVLRAGEYPRQLGPYVDAIRRLWPTLFANQEAALMLAFDVFVEIASQEGFVIDESDLRRTA